MFQNPTEPAFRSTLRELATKATEHRLTLENTLRPLVIYVNDTNTTSGLSHEWTDLYPVQARLRILAYLPSLGEGAFVGEVEYEDGAEANTIKVAESIQGMVLTGIFHLKMEAEDHQQRLTAGTSFQINSSQTHSWRCEGKTRSIVVFSPEAQFSGCSITPDLNITL